MGLDPERLTAAIAACAGGVFWGLFRLTTSLLAGQSVAGSDVIRAGLNVAAGLIAGILVAYFVAPALAPLIPWPSLRDLNAVGFGLGAGTWEIFPFVLGLARARAAKLGG